MAQGDAFYFTDQIGETSQTTVIEPPAGQTVKITSVSIAGYGVRADSSEVNLATYDTVSGKRVGKIMEKTGAFNEYGNEKSVEIILEGGGDVALLWTTKAGDGDGYGVAVSGVILKN
jgi:hypothetical protein